MSELRGNNILALAEALRDYKRNKEVLRVVCDLNKLATKQGITTITSEKDEMYLSHKYTYAIEHGLALSELLSVLKYEVLCFEEKHGKYIETDSNIEKLKAIAYKYNKAVAELRKSKNEPSQEMVESSCILYYVGVNVQFNLDNEKLTLIFADNGEKRMGPSIFSRDELALLTYIQTTRIRLLEAEKKVNEVQRRK